MTEVFRAADLPLRYNAIELLEANLATRPDKPALLSAERTLTFAEVAAEANRVATALLGLGLHRGECAAIFSPDCAAWVTSFFGILKLGGVATGLNERLTPAVLAEMLEDCGAPVLFVHEKLQPIVADIRDDLTFLRYVVVFGEPASTGDLSYADWIAEACPEIEATPTHREDPATLSYSSGTTGEPKGIFHAHKDLPLCAHLWGVDVLGLREEDRTFSNARLFFAYGLGGNLLFPWTVGASAVVRSGSPRDADAVLETIERFRPTVFYNAPTGYAALLASPEFVRRDLSSLRLCVSAGEALPAPLWHAWKKRTGLELIDGIGSTENFHIFLSNRPGGIRPGSSGKPVPGYELKIVDDEGRPVPAGKTGNLYVKGETAALFYLHQPERSRRTFLGEWLNTGDKYRVDKDGYYWHAGRADDMLKVGGIWVSPLEVESALLRHEAVLECAVAGVRDGSGLAKPKAWVCLKDGYDPSDALADQLITFCAAAMESYKRPRWIEFTASLPRTSTGKIQRFRLRAAAESSRRDGAAGAQKARGQETLPDSNR